MRGLSNVMVMATLWGQCLWLVIPPPFGVSWVKRAETLRRGNAVVMAMMVPDQAANGMSSLGGLFSGFTLGRKRMLRKFAFGILWSLFLSMSFSNNLPHCNTLLSVWSRQETSLKFWATWKEHDHIIQTVGKLLGPVVWPLKAERGVLGSGPSTGIIDRLCDLGKLNGFSASLVVKWGC